MMSDSVQLHSVENVHARLVVEILLKSSRHGFDDSVWLFVRFDKKLLPEKL